MSARNLRRNSPSRFSLLEILAVLFVPQGLPLGGGEIIYLRVDSPRCKISRKKREREREEKKRKEKKVAERARMVWRGSRDGESRFFVHVGEEKRRVKERNCEDTSGRNAALA